MYIYIGFRVNLVIQCNAIVSHILICRHLDGVRHILHTEGVHTRFL